MELQEGAKSMAIKYISSALLSINRLFLWILSEYNSMAMESDAANLSAPDRDFLSSCVKVIFQEFQLLLTGGQLKHVDLAHETWV